MCLSGRNESPIVVVMDEFSKSLLFDSGGQSVDENEQVGGNEVAIEEAHQTLANRIENGRKTTFCSNMVRNGPM